MRAGVLLSVIAVFCLLLTANAAEKRSVCDTGLGVYVDVCQSLCARTAAFLDYADILRPPEIMLNPPFVTELANYLAKTLDVQIDVIRVVLSLHLCVPIIALYQLLFPANKSAIARQLVGCILGVCVVIFAHGPTWGVILGHVLGSYIVCWLVGPRYCHYATFAYALGYLTIYQFRLMCEEYALFQMDLSTILMMRTIQVTTMSLQYHDSLKKDRLTAEANDSSIPMRKRTYKRDVLYRVLDKMPSPFEYLSMMFNVTCCFGPPAYDVVEFRKFMHSPPSISLRHSLPSILRSMFFADFTGVFCFLVIGAAFFPPSYLGTDGFVSQSLFYQYAYITGCIAMLRCKFYGFFKHIETIQLVAGMRELRIKSTGEPEFVPFSNMKVFEVGNPDSDLPFGLSGIEFTTRPGTLPGVWNVMVSRWLRHVYERSAYLGTVPAMIVTYGLSAFWHGIYFTIYVCFFSFLLLQITTAELSRRYAVWCLSLPMVARRIIAFVSWRAAIFGAEFAFIPFLIMDLPRGLRVWASLHYCMFAAVGVIFVILLITPSPKSKGDKANSSEQNSGATTPRREKGD